MKKNMKRSGRDRGRRGATYVLVLGVAMIVTVIGLSSILAARINTRAVAQTNSALEAEDLALSAAELALLKIQQNANWRQTYTHDAWTPDQALGHGSFKWKLVDQSPEQDGDLNDDDTEPVLLVAHGIVRDATQKVSVLLEPVMDQPIDALGYAIHSGLRLRIDAAQTLTASGAPVSTNDVFENNGALVGDVEAVTQSGGGTVTGTTTVPASIKQMPETDTFTTYVALATPLPYSGDIDKMVLTPTLNEYGGGLNANGVYYINSNGNDLTIKLSRIHGTLVLDAGVNAVIVDNQVLLHNFRADHPVLIIKGDLTLRYTSVGSSSETYLRESDHAHNYNPPDAPYEGQTDSDQLDDYPSEIQGLVYCTGKITWEQTGRVRGVVIGADQVDVRGQVEAVYDPAVSANPPAGFATSSGGEVQPVPGTWQRRVD